VEAEPCRALPDPQGRQPRPSLHARAGGGANIETKLDHIGLLLKNPEDVDAWAAYLAERGLKLDTAPRTHRDGARSFYARDPEGNRLQFLYHPPLSRLLDR